jgi:hypothetical protein
MPEAPPVQSFGVRSVLGKRIVGMERTDGPVTMMLVLLFEAMVEVLFPRSTLVSYYRPGCYTYASTSVHRTSSVISLRVHCTGYSGIMPNPAYTTGAPPSCVGMGFSRLLIANS